MRNREKSKTENTAITLIRFCVPLILSSILQQLYNWVDAFIVGNVAGEKALAAIGSTGTIVDLFLNAITGFTLGLCILFAQKYGAGKKAHITKILSVFSVILGGIFLLISLIGIAGAYPLLRIMNTTPDTIYMAKDYLQIILIGIPFLAVYNVYSSALRGIGNSRAPFVSVLFSSVVNIILDLVFVSVWHWGVVGAAIATVISQAFMTIFIILYSIKKHSCLRFSVKKWALDHSVLKEGLRLGIPPMIQSSITSLGGLILQNFMNGFGTQTVAAITTAYRVDTMVLLPIVNLGSGISTIVAQNYGAGRKKQIPKIVCVGTSMMFCISLLLTWLHRRNRRYTVFQLCRYHFLDFTDHIFLCFCWDLRKYDHCICRGGFLGCLISALHHTYSKKEVPFKKYGSDSLTAFNRCAGLPIRDAVLW